MNWASRTSALGPIMRPRRPRCWRILKKLPAHASRGGRPPADRDADRAVVARRDAPGPEERPGAAMGQERHKTTPAQGPALSEPLPLRRHLPRARHWGSACPALGQYPCHAGPPARGIPPGCASGAHALLLARPRRLAHHRRVEEPREHLLALPAFQSARAETPSKIFGSSCASPTYPIASSRPTTRSSMPPARPGTTLSTSLGESCPSGYAIGLTTVIRFDRWY